MTKQSNVKILFGANVKYHRNRLKISQEILAEKTNLHRNYIGEVERGLRNLSLENIYKISKALGVKMSDLLDFE
ncbi:helix-turn-helix domain-containing protein [Halobacillus litoralis]|uniref:Transcriptional regulator n=1 Tax=Halobacillus litoralis TaxID=45668 RepID=A0A410MJC9_9BACI|nr:helix-turn-helix transcriptional regulator [Halobacillus litoralis]QAS54829.1 transcriptional regulator [Halobacillus litoralis]